MENLSVDLSDVFSTCQVLEVVNKVEKLLVVLVIMPGNDGDSVVQLVAEGVSGVIDNDDVLNSSVAQDPEVLDEHPVDHKTVFSVKPVVDELAGRVQVVQHDVSVAPVRSSEDNHLKTLVRLPQALTRVRPDINPCVHELPVGNWILSTTCGSAATLSTQCTRVSSRSNTIVFLLSNPGLLAKFTRF